MKNSLNRNLLTFAVVSMFVSTSSLANVEAGVSIGTSKPKNYNECVCVPNGALEDIEAEVDIDIAVAQLRYVFENAVFVELRHGQGFSKSDSKVTTRSGESIRGLDVELDGLTNISVGYRFFAKDILSPYIMIGATTNIVLTTHLPDGPEFGRENYSNNLSYGAGINWNVSEKFTVGLEYFQYSSADLGDIEEVDLSTLSASLSYRF